MELPPPQTGLFAGSLPETNLIPTKGGFTEDGFDGSEFRVQSVEPPFRIEALSVQEGYSFLPVLTPPTGFGDSKLTRNSDNAMTGTVIKKFPERSVKVFAIHPTTKVSGLSVDSL